MPYKVELNEKVFEQAIADGVHPVIRSFVLDLRNRILVSFQEPKTGREYKRGGKIHRASAPGEAPAVDSGHLQNSIQPDFPTRLKGVLTIGSETGILLELGTNAIAPRPFVFPAIQGALEQFS